MMLYIAAIAAAFITGLIVSPKFRKPKVTASDILSAYLEQELSLLVAKLNQVKPGDMEIKEEILQMLQDKIQQARSLHNRLLPGSFESVHANALHHVAFLTWDTNDET